MNWKCKIGFHDWETADLLTTTEIKDRLWKEFKDWPSDLSLSKHFRKRVCLRCELVDDQMEKGFQKYRNIMLERNRRKKLAKKLVIPREERLKNKLREL